jgi:RNA polymerase-binding transcription factor DksA
MCTAAQRRRLIFVNRASRPGFQNSPIRRQIAMTNFHPRMTNTFDDLLAARERELCAVLDARDAALRDDAAERGEVTDSKDAAAGESMAVVDAAQAENAALELEQVLAARQRLREHEYGLCLACGEPIALERLKAMPASPYCASCQSERERLEGSAHLHH